MDIGTLVADAVESSAEWRRHKADEFPEDATRNLEAAASLDRIATELRGLEGSDLHKAVSRICEESSDIFCEKLSELTKEVGFWNCEKTGEGFLRELLNRTNRHAEFLAS